jgi:hypothetical protein
MFRARQVSNLGGLPAGTAPSLFRLIAETGDTIKAFGNLSARTLVISRLPGPSCTRSGIRPGKAGQWLA